MFCKVIKKEFYTQEAEDVYDISVENYHNFILANGSVVHNCDTYQSAQIQQQLIADGFDVTTISVDRLDSATKQCLPYAYLKSTIYDRRLKVYDRCDFLTEEVLGLERESDGHINHPENGTQGSKDAIDAVCGALWNASKHADEFAFEYGEDLETTINVSSSYSEDAMKKQVILDFESELNKAFDGMQDKVAKITKEQVKAIAEQKMPDLNAASLEAAMSMVAGTARAMGVVVVD